MSQARRLSEKWFHRGLWLVALVFAWFLIGLGSTVVGDLPQVEHRLELEDFFEAAVVGPLRERIRTLEERGEDLADERTRAELQYRSGETTTQAARETFGNWLSTRRATARPEQDEELVRRTQELDRLKATERELHRALENAHEQQFEVGRELESARELLREEEQRAHEALSRALRAQELRVFLYRLAFTLPLLGIAAWLFQRKRQSRYWPFVWGFALFAVFVFFVELVPYLPSYGGYVRYGVGLILTGVVGRQAIVALNHYLDRLRQKESLPDRDRRRELDYDLALSRLAHRVCPGCERPVDLARQDLDFCPHCGIGLHDRCRQCNTRKSAFDRFCFACSAACAPG